MNDQAENWLILVTGRLIGVSLITLIKKEISLWNKMHFKQTYFFTDWILEYYMTFLMHAEVKVKLIFRR